MSRTFDNDLNAVFMRLVCELGVDEKFRTAARSVAS